VETHFSQEELQLYKGNISLKEIGRLGQEKLKNSKVLIVGLGGLGSPVSLYLAAAGIGTLGLADFDQVETSNLGRQIVHSHLEVGFPKLVSAKKRLSELNPFIKFKLFKEKISASNIEEIIKDFDVIVDCSDNFGTRFLLGDVGHLNKKVIIHGSVSKFSGQVSVFNSQEDGPCYRCLYPEIPSGEIKNCSQEGVVGVVPGLVGTFQANEVIKHIVGIGKTLVGKVLLVDTLGMDFKTLELKKDEDCPLCGNNPSIFNIKDQKYFSDAICANDLPQISVQDFSSKLKGNENFLLLDVREPSEYELANLGGMNIPLGELLNERTKLDSFKEKEIIVHCHHGARSREACKVLKDWGFSHFKNLSGGIDKWSLEVDSRIARY
jgi:sulfur-carrier protein adenylyltransferase/sulfurtransferase